MACRRIRTMSTTFVVSLVVGACAGGEPPADPGRSEVPEAMAAFDSANALWDNPERTGADMEESANLLERAVQLDPDFAMAHVYLAQQDAWIHQNWDRTPERAARSLAAAQKAVALAPDLSEAHAAMGSYYYRIAKDYEQALAHYKRAQELKPGDAAALRMTGYVARRAGRLDDAVALLEEAATLSVDRASAWDLGNTYAMMGRYDEARAAYQEAHDTAPDHWQPPHTLAWLDVDERGDLTALRALLDAAEGGYVGNRWWLAR